ncbi:MAG: type ISP restriction/modification enzyme, partial [Armatimonadota bacterium]
MQPAHALKRYLETLRTIQEKAQATEELSYHHALLQLLRDLDPTAEFIHEPKRTVAGRPDFILLKNGAPVGYIEAEAFGTDLDRLTGHAKAQVDAFKQNLDNFLLTNFLEFRLYRGGECVIEAKLPVASASPPMNVGADPRVCPEKGHAQGRAPTVASASSLQLLTAFLSAQPLPIRTPNELAIHLARRTRQLKRVLLSTLEAQLKQPPDAPLELRNLYRAFQETLLPDLTPAEFADLYAQTIAYGLFAARCSVSVPADEKARSVGVPADEPSARRERYGSLGELATPQPSPEQILAYVYAILHAPAYRTRYAEFLRRDFPRIPLPPNRAVFEQLAALGQSLMALHLLEHPDLQIPLCKFPVAGDNK